MTDQKDITFKESMQKLETIANELEKGELSLDESVQKFEEGMELSKKCNEMLESAEKRINILIQNEGEIQEEPFKRAEEN